MRRSIKIGIWSLVGTLAISGGLALASTLYFNSKNNGNNSNIQKPDGGNDNLGGGSNGADTNNPITPPSNDNNNNNNENNDSDSSGGDENEDTNEPVKPDDSTTPSTPEQPKPEQPKPPTNPDKPTNPNKPINPPSNNSGSDNTIGQTIQTKFKLNGVFDKYKYVQKTTNYQDYFRNNKLIFDESKIKINTYTIFRPMIIKAMNLDLTKNTLKTNIYYRLNEDITELKLQVKWGIISNNSLISLEKKYYDNIYIKLR